MKRSIDGVEKGRSPSWSQSGASTANVKVGFHPTSLEQYLSPIDKLPTFSIGIMGESKESLAREGCCESLEFHLNASTSLSGGGGGEARAGTVHLRQVNDLASARYKSRSDGGSNDTNSSLAARQYARSWGVPTPVFMPVGTKGAVKATTTLETLGENLKAPHRGVGEIDGSTSRSTTPHMPICLANTYHLLNAPTPEVVSALGGLHKFEGYDGGMLTDSGGFQMVSLGGFCTIDENGVTFENPYANERGRAANVVSVDEGLKGQEGSNGVRGTNSKEGVDSGAISNSTSNSIVSSSSDTSKNAQEGTPSFGPSSPTSNSLPPPPVPGSGQLGARMTTEVVEMKVGGENGEEETVLSMTKVTNHYRKVTLRPEDSIISQNLLGADIIMALDDVCSSLTPIDDPRLKEATERTVRWIDRCRQAHQRKHDQSLFPIVQGGLDMRPGGLRDYCLEEFGKRENGGATSPGFAIGGLSGGESKHLFWRVVHHCCKSLPPLKPRYLMGVGYPVDVVVCTALGVDMFDCVYPTRTARFGVALTDPGCLDLKKKESNGNGKSKPRLIDESCHCDACRVGYTRERLREMYMGGTEEPGGSHTLAIQLITAHNITYMMSLVRRMRDAVLAGQGKFEGFVRKFIETRYPLGVKVDAKGKRVVVDAEKDGEWIPFWVLEALGAVNINF